nr:hypothetical protein [uncultured bacterium]
MKPSTSTMGAPLVGRSAGGVTVNCTVCTLPGGTLYRTSGESSNPQPKRWGINPSDMSAVLALGLPTWNARECGTPGFKGSSISRLR